VLLGEKKDRNGATRKRKKGKSDRKMKRKDKFRTTCKSRKGFKAIIFTYILKNKLKFYDEERGK
jgi:hypothetical protein